MFKHRIDQIIEKSMELFQHLFIENEMRPEK